MLGIELTLRLAVGSGLLLKSKMTVSKAMVMFSCQTTGLNSHDSDWDSLGFHSVRQKTTFGSRMQFIFQFLCQGIYFCCHRLTQFISRTPNLCLDRFSRPICWPQLRWSQAMPRVWCMARKPNLVFAIVSCAPPSPLTYAQGSNNKRTYS